jgi:hypothetical protein
MWADVLSTAPPGATYGFANRRSTPSPRTPRATAPPSPTSPWRFAFRGHLAQGRYSAYVRSTDSAGNVPRKLPRTAIRAFRVR